MRIALVSEGVLAHDEAYPASPAGRLPGLAAALAGQGANVTVYAAADKLNGRGRTTLCRGVAMMPIAAGTSTAATEAGPHPDIGAFAAQLAEHWRRRAPDAVHAYDWPSGVAALAATRGRNIPVVQTFHAPGISQPAGRRGAARPSAARIRLEVAIGRSVSAILVAASGTGSALCRLGVPRTAIRVMPPGVDIERFRPGGPAAPRGPLPRVLMVADLADEPGPATALRALTDLPGVELLIAGGPARTRLARDPGYRELTRLAGQLGVADRATFTGPVSQADMPALMRSADLLLNLSLDEALATITVDAMACGLPVIAAAAGAHRDAVIDGTTGLLVSPGPPIQLARRIGRLLASPMREGMAIAAASRARDRYSWERIAQQTLDVYEKSVQEHGQAGPAPPAQQWHEASVST